LSEKTGLSMSLPSEREWEIACRAGTDTPFWFGDIEADYSTYENLGDQSLRRLATESWGPRPPDLTARDERFNDGGLVSIDVGSFDPNPWGLFDMHGNVREWTIDTYASDSSSDSDLLTPMQPDMVVRPLMPARPFNVASASQKRAVRGGSWRDQPASCAASERFGYQPYQKVFNVGFRIVCRDYAP